MGAAENKQLMQGIFDELSKGNGTPLIESLADDVSWSIAGTSSWSRTFHGKQSILTELLGPLRARLAGPLKVTAHRIIAEGDHVVVEARGQGTTKAGDAYNNTYCWIYRIVEGRVHELVEYADTALVASVLGDLTRV